tara:strand:+ start:275 stop:466 length:192 start_codon:yes stop_codon:yes gene_type:complete
MSVRNIVRRGREALPHWMKDDAAKDRYIKIAGSTTAALDEKTKLKLLRELASEATLNTGELVG